MVTEILKINKIWLSIIAIALVVCGITLSNFMSVPKNPTQLREPEVKDSTDTEIVSSIYVDISGAVKYPGVYRLKYGERLISLINTAGGLKPGADIKDVNLAGILKDSDKIIIPSATGDKGQADIPLSGGGKSVNINTADEKLLDSIPGIGPAMAKRIIDYRSANGGFKKLEELKNVSGIGDAKLKRLESYVRIGQ